MSQSLIVKTFECFGLFYAYAHDVRADRIHIVMWRRSRSEKHSTTARFICCRHEAVPMRFVDENDLEVPVTTVQDDRQLWTLSGIPYKAGGSDGGGATSRTNVIWVQNPWTQLTNTDRGVDMPSATAGGGGGAGSQLPNNEECGIRDVWSHNLEDEFKTIRQVPSSVFLFRDA